VIDSHIKATGTEVGQAILLPLEHSPDLALHLIRNDEVMKVKDVTPPKPPASRPWWKFRGEPNPLGRGPEYGGATENRKALRASV
jgi:hypothetical protein